MRALRVFVLIIGVGLFPSLLAAQDVSTKKELAVFRLGYQSWNIPEPDLANIDEQIKNVFIGIRRFDVIGMNQRLEEGDVNDFVDSVKLYKGENVEIPEEVQMGKEFFTEADMNRLIGSFIVVIPSVSNFIVERNDDDVFEVTLKTSFTFFNVEDQKTFAHTFVETEGWDENRQQAVKEAVDGITLKLTYEIRKIPEFQLKTGILEVTGGEVYIEFGTNMGVKIGDEYLIISPRILDSGKTFTAETGLIIIKEVGEEVSVGKVIYANPKPTVGDQLRELPRLGLDTSPYLHVVRGGGETTAIIGVRQSVSRGFFDFRPFLGLEIPLRLNLVFGIPFNIYLGGEYDLYLGRMQLVPMAAIGVGAAYLWYLEDVEGVDPFLFTHVGGLAGGSLNYLVNNNIRVSLEGGYLYWFSFDPTQLFADFPGFFQHYGGVYVGAGVTIKY